MPPRLSETLLEFSSKLFSVIEVRASVLSSEAVAHAPCSNLQKRSLLESSGLGSTSIPVSKGKTFQRNTAQQCQNERVFFSDVSWRVFAKSAVEG